MPREAAFVPLAAFLDLSRSTLGNVEALGPVAALTGPIVRGDWDTVRTHLGALAPEDRQTYLALATEAARLAATALPDDLEEVASTEPGTLREPGTG